MSNKWTLGQMFRKNGKTAASDEKVPEPQNDIVPVQEEKEAPVENRSNTAYLPEVKGSLLKVWELWSQTSVPPLLSLSIPNNGQSSEELALVLERERLRLAVQLEQDAKKRLKLIEKGKELQNFSLNSSCRAYISRDGMYAWVFFFPPYGPEGKFEAGALGKALQDAGGLGVNPQQVWLQFHLMASKGRTYSKT